MNLLELKDEEAKIRILLNENLDKQKELKQKLFIEKHGIDIGDLIEYKRGEIIKQGILFKFNLNMYSNSLVVKTINNDGSITKRTDYNVNINNVKVIQKNYHKFENENE